MNRQTRLLFLLLFLPLAASPASAARLRVAVEPIVGYERVDKFLPDPHSINRFFYGARATAGFPLLALEAEATRATDQESFLLDDFSSSEVADRVKAGLRFGLTMSRFLSAQLRGGSQFSRLTRDETTGGITTRIETSWTGRPYVGAGFRVTLGSKVNFSFDATAVFEDPSQLSKITPQLSSGLEIHVP